MDIRIKFYMWTRDIFMFGYSRTHTWEQFLEMYGKDYRKVYEVDRKTFMLGFTRKTVWTPDLYTELLRELLAE